MTPRPANPAGAPSESESPSFEEALQRLESIVEELEHGALSLEDSIRRYEEGMGLSKRLTHLLAAAEERIERLVEREPGKPATEPFDLDDEGGVRREPGRPAGSPAGRGATPREGAEPPRGEAPRGTPRDGGTEELPF